MKADVHWKYLSVGSSEWNRVRCLYAYRAPRASEILYIGKSWGVSVRQRWCRSGKESFWDDLERDRGLDQHRVMIGEIALPDGQRLTHQLLCDIESLLIYETQPWGNIQSRSSRISRPGLVVTCNGDWPENKRVYLDDG